MWKEFTDDQLKQLIEHERKKCVDIDSSVIEKWL